MASLFDFSRLEDAVFSKRSNNYLFIYLTTRIHAVTDSREHNRFNRTERLK